tara:strand:+ start:1077 stop:1220 length:144 start_codon:yes stop_codon:yes gene_type:complete
VADRIDAAVTKCFVLAVRADLVQDFPAALAFVAGRFFNDDGNAGDVL